MAHGGEHIAFFVEQLQRSRIGNVEDGLDRDFAAHHRVVGPVDEPHAALAEDLPDLVAACQFSWGSGYLHGAPRCGGLSILLDSTEKCTAAIRGVRSHCKEERGRAPSAERMMSILAAFPEFVNLPLDIGASGGLLVFLLIPFCRTFQNKVYSLTTSLSAS